MGVYPPEVTDTSLRKLMDHLKKKNFKYSSEFLTTELVFPYLQDGPPPVINGS